MPFGMAMWLARCAHIGWQMGPYHRPFGISDHFSDFRASSRGVLEESLSRLMVGLYVVLASRSGAVFRFVGPGVARRLPNSLSFVTSHESWAKARQTLFR